MPGRTHPLLTDSIYHVFNKSIDHKILFADEKKYFQFLETARYYRSSFSSLLKFSKFEKLPLEIKSSYEKRVSDKLSFNISLLAYCIMPNHFHFLIKQRQKKGISNFVSQIQNSYTKYFNNLYQHEGPIFLHTFRSQPILSEAQLKHVSRYIHLNPYSSNLISNIEEIQKYPWSSFAEYLKPKANNLSDPEIVLSFFGNNKDRYSNFVLGNAEHQKMLEYCKHSKKW